MTKDFELDATNLGWMLHEGMLIPVRTDKNVAPDCLTKVIKCNCKVYNIFHRTYTYDIKILNDHLTLPTTRRLTEQVQDLEYDVTEH